MVDMRIIPVTVLVGLLCSASSVAQSESALDRGNELAEEAFRLSQTSDIEGAIAGYEAALEVAPELHGARFALARLYASLSRFEDAHREFALLVLVNPQDAAARRGEATALILLERWTEARQRLEDGLRTIVPRDGQLAHLLARVLVSAPDEAARNGSLALEMAMWVYEKKKVTVVGETVAMAFAEIGEFQRAIDIQTAMIQIVEQAGDQPLLEQMRERLATYQSQQPWRLKTPFEIIQSTELAGAG